MQPSPRAATGSRFSSLRRRLWLLLLPLCLQEKLGKLVSSSSFEPNNNNRFFFSDRSQVTAHSFSSLSFPPENPKKTNISHKPTKLNAALTKNCNMIPFIIAQKKIMAASSCFGDCTLWRVESQREPAKPNKIVSSINGVFGSAYGSSDVMIKENIKCGGIFAGFGSSSSYWVYEDFNCGRISTGHPHSRNRS